MEKKSIMNHEAVLMKIHRMAWQIYENNIEAKSIVVAGIKGGGAILSEMLCKEIESISGIVVVHAEVSMDKHQPIVDQVSVDIDASKVEGCPVVIVDDVLNSGRTLAYAVYPFLNMGCEKIQIAVLVNRSHRKFPVSADFAGISLATTLQEHIEVVFEDGKFEVFLR